MAVEEAGKHRLAGAAGGLVNGLFGGGGGMVLLPLLTRWGGMDARRAFATCVAVIFPVCAVSAMVYLARGGVSLETAAPYLAGGLVGGFAGGKLYGKVRVQYLRWLFAAFLLYAGGRYLL